jgi:catechol 2,3-dioxygenase-like lactoylglutathione lyase family enzyme
MERHGPGQCIPFRRHDTLGEEKHPIDEQSLGQSKKPGRGNLFRFIYDRRPVKITVREKNGGGVKDRYGGVTGVFVLEGELLVPSSSSPKHSTVLVFMHPAASMNMLSMPVGLARAGVHVLLCSSRYAGNDSALIMEKCVKDLGVFVAHAKETLGYKKVVLGGWSGGGSLSVFYQSQATAASHQRIQVPVDLSSVKLPRADGLLVLAAHASRARILTECLDPSIFLFSKSTHHEENKRLEQYDLYSKSAPKAPYAHSFLRSFRQAQIDRSLRITKWAREQVKRDNGGACFVVEGTMADPRWLDPSIDPNDRDRSRPWCYLGDPCTANNMPTGLARFSSAASWLSQFSYHDTNADAVSHIRCVEEHLPCLFLENGADDGCPTTHPRDVFRACVSRDKTYVRIPKARHYYDGQPEKLKEAVRVVMSWLVDRDFVDIAMPGEAPKKPPNLSLQTMRTEFDGSRAMQITGINHLALVSSDMERTCRFYGQVLGLRLSKTIALPGGGQHFFFELLDGNSLAFFFFPDSRAPNPGISAPSQQQMLAEGKHPSAMGSMNHVAFNVPLGKLTEYRKRIKGSNLSGYVSPIVYHADVEAGYVFDENDERVSWKSCYFFDPDGVLLELTCQTKQHTKENVEEHVSHVPLKALWRSQL